jgi:hypothetical protein
MTLMHQHGDPKPSIYKLARDHEALIQFVERTLSKHLKL